MKTLFLALLLVAIAKVTSCQDIINEHEVRRIETALSSDSMLGRKAFTPAAEKAADFISNEFKKIGLELFNGLDSYRQTFTVLKPKFKGISATFGGQELDAKNVIAITSKAELTITEKSGYQKVYIKEGTDFSEEAIKYVQANENLVVFVDEVFSRNFPRLTFFKRYLNASEKSVVFILGNPNSENYQVIASHDFIEQQGSNIIGVLPGKTRKNEYVIYSGHYDHLGTGRPVNNDSIFNGANDDASGITAIITMAQYYKQARNNDRTLIFAAFTAEELGGFGSRYFSKQVDANKVAAMLNLEMIGTESKWGRNSAYITGFDKSDMGLILQKNLKGSKFTFYPDPYPAQNLFYRSDNATLAKEGVPAHTISTSKMDSEPNYHKLTDEVSTLDIANMTEIIKSVLESAKTIINGDDTPTRVKPE
jgi:hypothetical protein